MTDSMIFYRSFYEAITKLEPMDKNSVFDAIMEYSLNAKEMPLSGVALAMFTLIRPQLEANAKRRENGNKGGRPKKTPKPNHNLDETKPEPNANVNANANVTTLACSSAGAKSEFQKVYEFGCELFPSLTTAATEIIHKWLEDGCLAERDINETIKRHTGKSIKSWTYFTGGVMDAKATRETPLPKGKPGFAAKQDKPFEPSKPIELSQEQIEKNRRFYLEKGLQHKTYNPEGIRQATA